MAKDYSQLEAALGYNFKDINQLKLALTHPSFAQEKNKGDRHNQRLEFLGDSILSASLAEYFFHNLPAEREGFLSTARSTLVKGRALANIARDLNIPEYIRISYSEHKAGNANRDSILEDALEAIIGAVFLESGFETARNLVIRLYGNVEQRLEEQLTRHNPKGRLQEYYQQNGEEFTIDYIVAMEEGPDHAKEFTIELHINGACSAIGKGHSKKEAEEMAALDVLSTLGI